MFHWKERAREVYKGVMVRSGQGFKPPTGKEFVRLFARFNKPGRGEALKELLEKGITSEERQEWFEIGLKLKFKAQIKAEVKALASVGKRLASSKDVKHFMSMFKLPEWNFYFAEGRPFAGLHNSPPQLEIALSSTIEANKNALVGLDRARTVKDFLDETERRAKEKMDTIAQAERPQTPEEQAELAALFAMVDPDNQMVLGPTGQPAGATPHLHPQPPQTPAGLPTLVAGSDSLIITP